MYHFRFVGYVRCADGLWRKACRFNAGKDVEIIVRDAAGELVRVERPLRRGTR